MLWAWFFILIIIFHFVLISVMSCHIKHVWSSVVAALGHLVCTWASTLLCIHRWDTQVCTFTAPAQRNEYIYISQVFFFIFLIDNFIFSFSHRPIIQEMMELDYLTEKIHVLLGKDANKISRYIPFNEPNDRSHRLSPLYTQRQTVLDEKTPLYTQRQTVLDEETPVNVMAKS